jgi:hypothetical protein
MQIEQSRSRVGSSDPKKFAGDADGLSSDLKIAGLCQFPSGRAIYLHECCWRYTEACAKREPHRLPSTLGALLEVRRIALTCCQAGSSGRKPVRFTQPTWTTFPAPSTPSRSTPCKPTENSTDDATGKHGDRAGVKPAVSIADPRGALRCRCPCTRRVGGRYPGSPNARPASRGRSGSRTGPAARCRRPPSPPRAIRRH